MIVLNRCEKSRHLSKDLCLIIHDAPPVDSHQVEVLIPHVAWKQGWQ